VVAYGVKTLLTLYNKSSDFTYATCT